MVARTETVAWLDPVEQRAWRSLVRTTAYLDAALDAELVAQHNLPLADYAVLAILSEADDRRLRMHDLAERLQLSPSGLTRRVDRLVRAGLVDRVRCDTDGRGTFAALTDRGLRRLEEAAPTHVDGVRRHVVDRLDRAALTLLGELLDRVTAPPTKK